MSPRSKKDYMAITSLCYKKASRSEKTPILDKYRATCGCQRKYAIRTLRLLKRFTRPQAKRRGKPAIYHKQEIVKPLKQIWLVANLPCSKRLKTILPL
jgi:hypothetical protein